MANAVACHNDASRADQDRSRADWGVAIAEDAFRKQKAAAAGSVASHHCTVRVGDDQPSQHSSGRCGCTSRAKTILAVLAAVVIIAVALGVGLAVGLPKKGEHSPQNLTCGPA
jgi:hypothetical protein